MISVKSRRDPRTVQKVLAGDEHVSVMAREDIERAVSEMKRAGELS